jgi:hypothetical protein
MLFFVKNARFSRPSTGLDDQANQNQPEGNSVRHACFARVCFSWGLENKVSRDHENEVMKSKARIARFVFTSVISQPPTFP